MGVKLGLSQCTEGVWKEEVLRRIFGSGSEEVAEHWRRQHNEELQNLYASSSIIKVIKSRRVR
jgi:hypothetical protein